MNIPSGLPIIIALFVVAPASATYVEFSEAQHTGENVFAGDFAAAALYTDGGRWQNNAIHLETDELMVWSASADQFIDMGEGGAMSSPPEHKQDTFHNVVLDAWPNNPVMYTDYHAIGQTNVTFRVESADSGAPSDDSHDDITPIRMPAPRTTDVSDSLQVESEDHVSMDLKGGASMNLWGWTVRITSDEGVYEYETGPSRDTEAGPVSTGSAMQVQVESTNATVEVTGTYNDVHRVWIRDAVAQSDRMDLKLTHDNDLPTDQEVFTERSQLTVLAVTDTVSADVVPVPLPSPEPGATPDPEDAAEPVHADNATAGITGATDPSGQGVHGAVAPDHGMSSMPLWAWILVTLSMVAVGVFFIVRQMIGWPVGTWFMTRARDLHEDMYYMRATVVATIGHWLRPMDARHRYYRGIARVDRGHDHSALRDLLWAQKRFTNLPEYRAEASYQAARIAARLHRPGIAGDMVAKASRVDESYLWCAVKDKELCRLAGHPEFETFLALGLNARLQ